MISLQSIHHIAIICSDYGVSRKFYTEVLGLSIASEHYREERKSWKLDLELNNTYLLELFSFPDPPQRLSQPEACGLRHLAFSVRNLEESITALRKKGVETEGIRTDEFTGKRFIFFTDPDGLPLELYEL
ncbi:MAG: VOC family protein [Cyclobacteriaceae bacterium]